MPSDQLSVDDPHVFADTFCADNRCIQFMYDVIDTQVSDLNE